MPAASETSLRFVPAAAFFQFERLASLTGILQTARSSMSGGTMLRLGTIKEVARFQEYLRTLELEIPCDADILLGAESPLLQPVAFGGGAIGNRIAINPMEGWDGTSDGRPSEHTIRRWRRFGQSGAKLIWGGEAVAVCHDGRANPNQLVIGEHTREGLAQLRAALMEEHKKVAGSD